MYIKKLHSDNYTKMLFHSKLIPSVSNKRYLYSNSSCRNNGYYPSSCYSSGRLITAVRKYGKACQL